MYFLNTKNLKNLIANGKSLKNKKFETEIWVKAVSAVFT